MCEVFGRGSNFIEPCIGPFFLSSFPPPLLFFLSFSFLSFFLASALHLKSGACRLFFYFLDHAQLDTHTLTHSRAAERAISRSLTPPPTQHTDTSDQHPCPQWDSNPQSQQPSSDPRRRQFGHRDRPVFIRVKNFLIIRVINDFWTTLYLSVIVL